MGTVFVPTRELEAGFGARKGSGYRKAWSARRDVVWSGIVVHPLQWVIDITINPEMPRRHVIVGELGHGCIRVEELVANVAWWTLQRCVTLRVVCVEGQSRGGAQMPWRG